jgi:hypothetical protein
MLTVYFFLPPLQEKWGSQRAFAFYTIGGIVAGVGFAIMQTAFGLNATLIGASGSALALLGACAYLFPGMMLFGIIPIRFFAIIYGILYVLSTFFDRNLSDAAHLFGLAFGVAGPWLAGPMLSDWLTRREAVRERKAVQAEIHEQQEVDRILAKVSEQGMQSLTRVERKTLQTATRHQQQRDAARAKKWR